MGYLGDIILYFHVLLTKCFICQLLSSFFLFQIKTCGFHLKEEGKELLGMLMTTLANIGYCVLLSALCQKLAGLFAKCVNCYSHKLKINCISQRHVGAIDTCQLLMLTKCVNCYLKILMFAHKVLQTHQKQLTHFPIQCIMHYKHNVLLRTCQLFNW